MTPDLHLPVLDPDHVIRRLGGTREDFREVADVFVDELPRMRAQIANVDAMPTSALISLLHELANTFGVIGALRAERLCRDHEIALHAEPGPAVAGLRAMLAQQLELAAQALAHL